MPNGKVSAKCRRLKNGNGNVSRTRHTCRNLCQPPNLQRACSKTMDPLLGVRFRFHQMPSLCQGRRLKNGHGNVSRTRHTCQNLCQPPNLQLASSKTMDPLLGHAKVSANPQICNWLAVRQWIHFWGLGLGFSKWQNLCQAEISANPQICNWLAVRPWIHFWGLGLGFYKCQNLCQGRRLKNGQGNKSRTRHTCRFRFCQMPKSLSR